MTDTTPARPVDPVRLEARVGELARTVGAAPDLLPTFGWSRDGGYPHVECAGETMHWVVRERGRELQRRSTTDEDELLYWVFEAVTHTMASTWARGRLRPWQPFRVTLFKQQFRLLGQLDPAWVARRKAELGPILDEVGLR